MYKTTLKISRTLGYEAGQENVNKSTTNIDPDIKGDGEGGQLHSGKWA
jgi:hypothetical protein